MASTERCQNMEKSYVAKRKKLKSILTTENRYIRDCLAECLGTFLLVVFGCGSMAQYILPPIYQNNPLATHFGFGLGTTMGIWCSRGVTGGHINPAVTLANWVLGRLPTKRAIAYMIGQYIGSFLSAVCIYVVYYDALNNYDGGIRQVTGPNATAAVFATYPQEYLSIGNAFIDQLFGTLLLVMCGTAIKDCNNCAPSDGYVAVAVGLLVAVIGICFGGNCGYAINPARDLSPRLFTAMAGWGTEVFTAYNCFSWVPIVAPYIGGTLGAWLYLLFVGNHCPPKDTSV